MCALVAVFVYRAFSHFPSHIPKPFEQWISTDYSFVSSLLHGINRRRSNPFFFADPQYIGDHFRQPLLPLIYTAGLCSFGASYPEAVALIAFATSVTLTSAIFFYARQYTKRPGAAVIVYLLNGGWAFAKGFFGNPYDLVRHVNNRTPVPWHQTLALAFIHKSASFSLPIALFAYVFLQLSNETFVKREYYIPAMLLIILCPSPATAIALSLLGTANPHFCVYSLSLLAFSLLRAFFGLRISFVPLYQGYQMWRGTMYAWIVVWWDAFGPLFISLVLGLFFCQRFQFLHRTMVSYCVFGLLTVFRVGNSDTDNIIAIAATVFPIIVVNFLNMYDHLQTKNMRNPMRAGVLQGVFWCVVALYVFGGFVGFMRLHGDSEYVPYLTENDLACGRWFLSKNAALSQKSARKQPIVTFPEAKIPAALVAGRQLVLGDASSVWNNGGNVLKGFDLLRQAKANGSGVDAMLKAKSQFILEHVPLKHNFFNETNKSQFQVIESNADWILYQYQSSN